MGTVYSIAFCNVKFLIQPIFNFRHCGLRDPSWAELRHFVWFLNIQLLQSDLSVFCGPFLAQDLPGFKRFVVKCMIQMSRDFATTSLVISEETPSHATQIEEVCVYNNLYFRKVLRELFYGNLRWMLALEEIICANQHYFPVHNA